MYYFYRTLIREANPERGNTGMLLEIMNELEVNASDTDQITDELIEAFALNRKKLEAAAAEQVSS
jgi:hypothetical protein